MNRRASVVADSAAGAGIGDRGTHPLDMAFAHGRKKRDRQAALVVGIGTGQARSWNDLANAVFAAMGQEPRIEYIEMPERLQGNYQYHTQATIEKLRNVGCELPFRSLEDAVADYVQNHLATPQPHLSTF